MDTLLSDIVSTIWDRQDRSGVQRWALFPCGKNKKPIYPKGHKYGNGHNSATTDSITALDMFDGITVSQGYIGVAGGQISGGIFALDIDVKHPLTPESMKNPETIEAVIINEYGDLPHTAFQSTPSGGRHRIYYDNSIGALNDAFRVEESKIAADIKGDGGYFVLYDTNMDFDSIVEAPAWIGQFISERKRKKQEEEITFTESFSEGNRNDGLTRIAGKFWNYGFDRDVLTSFMYGYNDRYCSPPLSRKDVDRIIQSAVDNFKRDYEQVDIGEFPVNAGSGEDFNCMADFLVPIEPETFVLDKAIIEGGLVLFTGESGCGKTWATLDLCFSIVTGDEWLGLKTMQKNVHIIDEESGKKRLIRRFRKVAAGRGLLDISSGEIIKPDSDLGSLQISADTMRQTDLRSPQFIRKLENKIVNKNIGFILIDALADVTPGANENDVKDMLPALNNLKYLAEKTGVTIAMIHHTGKNATSSYRGSSAIVGAVDAMLLVTREKDSEIMKIESTKERDIEKIQIGAKITFTEYSTTITKTDYRSNTEILIDSKKEDTRKILQIINDHPDGILQSAVKKMAGNFDGKNPKTIERYIDQLVKEELIIKEYNNNRGCSQQITLKINIEKEPEIKNLLHISDFVK
jgi:RecA-family ATPase